MEDNKHKHINIFIMILLDIVGIGAALLIYALFHHVLPQKLEAEGTVISRPEYSSTETSATSSQTESQAETTASSEETSSTHKPSQDDTSDETSSQSETTAATETSADNVNSDVTFTPITSDFGMFGEKFADKFTSGDTIKTDTQYISNSCNVTINRYSDGNLAYYMADIYVKNIDNFMTAFAEDTYGKSITEGVVNMSVKNNAIVATNGDYYGIHDSGIVIRNGIVYRSNISWDACILYYDGTMETYTASEFNIDDVVAKSPYQGWTFGPALVKNGKLLTDFSSSGVAGTNPRTAIGYFEPGHYCLITVDGRQNGYSTGLTLAELAKLMYGFGCTEAYNLDGGGSAMMTYDGELINSPWKNGREASDIIYIGEVN